MENNNILKNAKDIADIIKNQRKNLDLLNTQIYGTNKYDNVDDVVQNVSGIVNTFNNTNTGSLLNKLTQYEKKMDNDSRTRLEDIKQSIENNRSLTGFQSLLNENYSTISKYEN